MLQLNGKGKEELNKVPAQLGRILIIPCATCCVHEGMEVLKGPCDPPKVSTTDLDNETATVKIMSVIMEMMTAP